MRKSTVLVLIQALLPFLARRTLGWTTDGQTRRCLHRHRYAEGSKLWSSTSATAPEDDPLLESNDVAAEKLRAEARKLREEIEQFEQQKANMEQREADERQAELDRRQELVDRYSVVVPILKPDGTTVEEKIQFPPRLEDLPENKKGSSSILLCEAPLPLGILLGEHELLEGMTEVDEVAEGSNGELAGIQEGDLLRACTACKMEMVGAVAIACGTKPRRISNESHVGSLTLRNNPLGS